MRAKDRRGIWRYWAVGLLLILAPGCLGYRFWLLTQDPRLQERATRQQTRTVNTFIPRLTVVDRQDNILATDQPLFTLYVHPQVLLRELTKDRTDPEALQQQIQLISRLLAPLVDQSPEGLATRLRDATVSTVVLSRRVDAGTFRRVRSLVIPRSRVDDTLLQQFEAQHLAPGQRPEAVATQLIPGLEFEMRRQRTYPLGEPFSDVLGFVDYDGKGRAGIEQFYERLLLHPAPPRQVSVNGLGQMLAVEAPAALFSQGLNFSQRLRLTLDTRLQDSATRALNQGMALHKAKRGAAMVMDPQTGAILALAVAPTYDNNRFGAWGSTPKVYQPWPVTELYEPGSTFKPINIAIGLDSGKVKASDVVYDPGSITLSGYTIRNFDGKGRGALTVTDVLKYSNNIGMIKLMSKLRAADYYDRLRKIGIGRKSGVDLPNEAAGVFKDRQQFIRYPVEAATPAFGQGITMTPLQLLRFHCALANGGYLVTPHVVDALVDQEGHVLRQVPQPPPKRIFSEEATRQVRQMLVQVVESGSGKNAQVPGYVIAGKTGTAQKVAPGGRGYVPGKRVTSFVGHFPGDAPRYVILVVFDEPEGRVFGGGTAAPVVQQILKELIGYEGIPPTHTFDPRKNTTSDALN
ncbi:peptidoglycan D,D-transpeptidase FtsI family protein [Anthocerotibacter panamensis]|uniref:peptidoglycan D,D-transpeptidase FtsI family protein n=1 Tax=Anthocerotibacter panamensis TaxID=2857077 RepID=UPI001C401B83|nr:penicillin-binding protein 2 [Anthocerotibacter panamensis]